MNDTADLSPSVNAAPEYPSSRHGWYAVVVLYLSYTFSFVDRAIIAYLVGPIRADLKIDDFEFSLI